VLCNRPVSSILKDLEKAMLTTLKNREEILPDVLGLTSLHMLALSQHRNLEVFICLLSFDFRALTTKDEFEGEVPIAYACRTNAPTEIVKLLLQAQIAVSEPTKSTLDLAALIVISTHASGPNSCETLQYLVSQEIANRVKELGCKPWQESVQSSVSQIPDVATALERKRQIELVRSTLELCEHKKSILFLEQALWKIEIEKWKTDEAAKSSLDEAERWSCRINCGDEIVISNVLPFLGW